MKTFAKTFALVLFSLPLIASAAGKTASSSMQVSFVVKESCSVESTASAKTPAVACQLNTPYQLSRSADKAAPATTTNTANGVAVRPDAGAQDWTLYF
jgi:hypothetical protein